MAPGYFTSLTFFEITVHRTMANATALWAVDHNIVLSELARPAAGLDMAHMSMISAEPTFK